MTQTTICKNFLRYDTKIYMQSRYTHTVISLSEWREINNS